MNTSSAAGELFLLQQFVTISNGILVILKAMQGQGNVRLVVPTHVATENVNDEKSSLETSILGSITTSSYDILNINYAHL